MKFIKQIFNSGESGAPPASVANSEPKAAEQPALGADFAQLDLPAELNRAISDLGFTSCTPVQKKVLPYSLDGRDIIAQAQTGTGKTAAFLISIITYDLENPELADRPPGTPFALIIAPTRELVMQIAEDAKDLTRHTDINVVAVVGGMDYEKQKKQLAKPVELVVATPGRLLDFCRSGVINLSRVESLVLDEADRMLSMGFIPDVKAIINRTPKKSERQTQLYSATFSRDIMNLAGQWTLDPVQVEIEPEHIAADSVEQIVYLTSESDKFTVLFNLIRYYKIIRTIIFVNRRDETRKLEEKLHQHGFKTGLLTGEVNQKKRVKTLDEFKDGEIEVLVATDVAGRGIHVDDISHVINFNLPEDPEDYVHRIGRTGRAGAEGMSISLACENEAFMLPNIEELLGKPLSFKQPEDFLLEPLPDTVRKPRKQPPSKPNQRRKRR